MRLSTTSDHTNHATVLSHQIEDTKAELHSSAGALRFGQQCRIEFTATYGPAQSSVIESARPVRPGPTERRSERTPIGGLNSPAAQEARLQLSAEPIGNAQRSQLGNGTRIHTIAARFVARESRLLQDEHIAASARQRQRQSRPSWPSAYDDHFRLRAFHLARSQLSAQRKAGCGLTSASSPARSAKERTSPSVYAARIDAGPSWHV